MTGLLIDIKKKKNELKRKMTLHPQEKWTIPMAVRKQINSAKVNSRLVNKLDERSKTLLDKGYKI